jgi:hypothetical protein
LLVALVVGAAYASGAPARRGVGSGAWHDQSDSLVLIARGRVEMRAGHHEGRGPAPAVPQLLAVLPDAPAPLVHPDAFVTASHRLAACAAEGGHPRTSRGPPARDVAV